MISSKVIAKALIRLANEAEQKPQRIIEDFFDFAKKNNIAHQLRAVLEYLEAIKAEQVAAEGLTVVFATPASDFSIERIKKFVGANKAIPVKTRINPALIGGFVVYFGGKMYDASLLNNIKKLRDFALQA